MSDDAGPRLELVHRGQWLSHLRTEKVTAWYHQPRLNRFRQLSLLLAPRGYSRGDDSDMATSGDLIRLRWDIYELARAFAHGTNNARRAEAAAKVAVHEYLHCLTDWTPTRQQLDVLEHPRTMVAGVAHAVGMGFPVNAFTGLLRLNWEPDQVVEGLDWLRKVQPEPWRP